MPRGAVAIEDALKPLFEYMVNPEQIEFEDDIVLTIKSMIRKTGYVSQVQWTLFPLLYGVFEKNKRTFGNLLDCINQYLVTARDVIGVNRDYIKILLKMASESLFTLEPKITIHNSEGAILL